MALKEQITADMKTAMKAGDKQLTKAIRLLTAAFKQVEVDERIEVDDARALAILEKQLKQRKESISQYAAAGRDDLVAPEQYEAGVIQRYLPEPMSDAEMTAMIEQIIADTGAAGMQDMGKVMGQLKGKAEGRADMGKASGIIKAKLAG